MHLGTEQRVASLAARNAGGKVCTQVRAHTCEVRSRATVGAMVARSIVGCGKREGTRQQPRLSASLSAATASGVGARIPPD